MDMKMVTVMVMEEPEEIYTKIYLISGKSIMNLGRKRIITECK